MKGETTLQRERQYKSLGNIRQREQIQNETPDKRFQILREKMNMKSKIKGSKF